MDQEDYETIMITIDFTLLFSAALRTLLGSWVLGYEVANYIRIRQSNCDLRIVAPNLER